MLISIRSKVMALGGVRQTGGAHGRLKGRCCIRLKNEKPVWKRDLNLCNWFEAPGSQVIEPCGKVEVKSSGVKLKQVRTLLLPCTFYYTLCHPNFSNGRRNRRGRALAASPI